MIPQMTSAYSCQAEYHEIESKIEFICPHRISISSYRLDFNDNRNCRSFKPMQWKSHLGPELQEC